jgi:hypothetical protein
MNSITQSGQSGPISSVDSARKTTSVDRARKTTRKSDARAIDGIPLSVEAADLLETSSEFGSERDIQENADMEIDSESQILARSDKTEVSVSDSMDILLSCRSRGK